MEEPLISIIVPVYNVEPYVEECLHSILYQTYKNIEVIIVNDGSKDGSIDICKNFVNRDCRFRIINQNNQGLSVARNNGVTEAKGQYFTFVDSDDYLDLNMIELLVECSKRTKCEIAICGTALLKNDEIIRQTLNINEIVPSYEIVNMFFKQESGMIHSAWGKLFARNIYYDLVFPVGRLYEDQFVIYKAVLKHKCAVVDNTVYYYRIRKGSIITNHNNINKKTLDMMDSMIELENLIDSEWPNLKKTLNFKIVNDSITLIKYNLLGNEYNKSLDFAIKNIKKNHFLDLVKEGMGISHLCQFLMIKHCFYGFRKLFLKKQL